MIKDTSDQRVPSQVSEFSCPSCLNPGKLFSRHVTMWLWSRCRHRADVPVQGTTQQRSYMACGLRPVAPYVVVIFARVAIVSAKQVSQVRS